MFLPVSRLGHARIVAVLAQNLPSFENDILDSYIMPA